MLIIAMTYAESAVFTAAFNYTRMEKARPQLHLLEVTYGLKMDQIGFGFKGQSRNPNHRALLAERALGSSANWADIATYEATSRSALAAEITNRKIEYATLLDANGMIVVNANSNRTGELWDPAGLVTIMRNHWSLGQIKTTEILAFTDVRRENPPIHRERDQEADPSPPLHPWDTGTDPLVRWMLTPIVSSGSLLGILVAGDIVDGKAAIPERVVNALGSGYAAVYLSFPGVDGPRLVTEFYKSNGFPRASQIELGDDAQNLVNRLQAVSDHRRTVWGTGRVDDQEIILLGKRINPRLFENTEAPDENAVLRKTGSAFIVRGLFVEREDTRQSFTIIRVLEALSRAADIIGVIFVFTGALLPVWRAAKPARAYLTNREELYRLANQNQPLYQSKRVEAEKLAKQKQLEEKMRKKKLAAQKRPQPMNNQAAAKYNRQTSVGSDHLSDFFNDEEIELRVKDLRRSVISDRHQFLKAVCHWRLPSLRTLLLDSLVSVVGLSLMVMTLYLSLNLMTANLESQAVDEANMLSIAYMIKVNQMAFGFRGVSNNAAVRTVSSLTSPSEVASSSSLSSVRSALNGEVNVRKIEVAMMVKVPDLWVMAVATSLDQSFEGSKYTYNDLPQRVVNTKKQIIATDAITFADVKPLGSPEWDDKLALLGYTGLSDTDAEFSVSKLSAADICQEDTAPIVGRFTATPVYASSDTTKSGAVEAVLISADMLNGKTAINEWSMTAFQRGYVAIYILADTNGDGIREPVLLGSLLSEPPSLTMGGEILAGLRQLVEPERELERAQEAYDASELRVDVDIAEGQETALKDLLRDAETGTQRSIMMDLRDRQYFVSAVQAPPDLINFVPTSERYDAVFLVRGVWTGEDNPTRALRITSMTVILFLALTIKIAGGFFVWRRVAGPLQHALLGIRAMLAGLSDETVLKRAKRVEAIGLQIEPYPLTRDPVAFCWFILKYERILFDMEMKEENRLVKMLRKFYPQLLRRKISRPWCCLCSSCGGIEVIGADGEDEEDDLFTPRSRKGKADNKRRSSFREEDSLQSSSHNSQSPDHQGPPDPSRILMGDENEQGEVLAVEVFSPYADMPVGEHPLRPRGEGALRRSSSRLPGAPPRLEKRESRARFFTLPVSPNAATSSAVSFKGSLSPNGIVEGEDPSHSPSPSRRQQSDFPSGLREIPVSRETSPEKAKRSLPGRPRIPSDFSASPRSSTDRRASSTDRRASALSQPVDSLRHDEAAPMPPDTEGLDSSQLQESERQGEGEGEEREWKCSQEDVPDDEPAPHLSREHSPTI
uniref:Uncharacterized protein n=1 Tax=Chromera velia CCMP2878 TaxID=1169474 RepID=A0A0G4F367_9ALVE|eukprot:Cvel_2667.t1-p1 / transcript=Cvel_2667.t1 / gene=Cvel_2667 / organism=Chromera_velia_CCMP2878 / gene_product=hypothetical protein / transcript_product=hypothetical protein / location=Cvel_scaffold106:77823-87081(-) / protein_length=1290 / sequence_SO=supercontig / SO=protein_coding / is_pseudo=false